MARKSELNTSIEALEVGQVISFPIEKMASVRVAASNLGAMLRREFSTGRNQENKALYDVKRIS